MIFMSSYKIALYFPILLSAHGRSRSAIDRDSIIQKQLRYRGFSFFSRVTLTLSPAVLIFLLHQRHRFRTQWMRLQDGRVKREVFIYLWVKMWSTSSYSLVDLVLFPCYVMTNCIMDDYHGWNPKFIIYSGSERTRYFSGLLGNNKWGISYQLNITCNWLIFVDLRWGHLLHGPPLDPISFIFMQFSANKLPNNRLMHSLWGWFPSGKSWICHCSQFYG